MASNSTKKSKSSGMRILWLPGRKSHSKERISTRKTEKKVSELNGLPSPDFEGESNNHAASSVSLTTCSLTAQSRKSECDSSIDGSLTILSDTATLQVTSVTAYCPNLRPKSSLPEIAPTRAMTSPTVVTTAEIQDIANFISPEDLPKVPTAFEKTDAVLKSSRETTASVAQGAQEPADSLEATPQKIQNKNHNNNQEDINSIESISTDFDWIDEMVHQRNCNEMMHKNKRKKESTKGLESSPEADQLDDQLYSYTGNDLAKHNSSKGNDGDDDLVVKCLYYTLMCCDCRIS